jgi:hypothetical protein
MIAHHEARLVISSIYFMSKYSSKTNTGGHEEIPKCVQVRREIGTFSRSLGSGKDCILLSKTYRTI